MSEAIDNHPPF